MEYRFKVLFTSSQSRADQRKQALINKGLVYHAIKLVRPAFSSVTGHEHRNTYYCQNESRATLTGSRCRSHSSADLQTEDWQPSLSWFYQELANKLYSLRESEDSHKIEELKTSGFSVEYIDESSDFIAVDSDETLTELLDSATKQPVKLLISKFTDMNERRDREENIDIFDETEYKYQFLQSEDYSPQTEALSLIDLHDDIIGTTCSICGNQICGSKYFCCVCDDFQICESCKAHHQHDAMHPLLLLHCLRWQQIVYTPNIILRIAMSRFMMAVCEEVTPKSGEKVEVNKPSRITWKIKNYSCNEWPAQCYLKFTCGSLLTKGQTIPIETVINPGQTNEISIDICPTKTGKIFSAWRFVSEDGVPFGSALVVKVVSVDKVDESMIPDSLIAQNTQHKRCASALLPRQVASPEQAKAEHLGNNRSFFSLLSESIAKQRSIGKPLYPSATKLVAGVKSLFPSITAERTHELDSGLEKIMSYFSPPRSTSVSAHSSQQAKSVSPHLEREYPIPKGVMLDTNDDLASRGNEASYSVSEISQMLAEDEVQESSEDDQKEFEEWGTHSPEKTKSENAILCQKNDVCSEANQEKDEERENDEYFTEIVL